MSKQLPQTDSEGINEPQSASSSGVDDVQNIGNAQDRLYKRRLGWPSLAAMTFSGMVGSGWLFAAFYAAKASGPLAFGAWVLAALATLLVGITFVELGVTRPVAGGNVRWPSLISGPFVGVMIGWVILLQTAVGTPSEASGLLQYAAHWWPSLFSGGKLSGLGLAVACVVLILFTVINFFGVVLLARVTNLVTIFKIAVPVLTVILLIASGFDSSNIKTGGGLAPLGAGAMLTAITGAGLVYSFGGIQLGAIMVGETKNPRRNVPLGTFVGLGGAFLLYILLQAAFIGGVPSKMLASVGWSGLNFDSPFAQLALLMNLGWLSTLLLVDAVVSPGGSLFLGIGTAARNTYGLGQNHTLPAAIGKMEAKYGTPARALMVNLILSIAFLFIFQSWQNLVQALGMFFAVSYAVIAVAAGANRFDPRLRLRPWAKGMVWIAPASFIFSGLIMYWAGWPEVRLAVLLFLVSIPLYAYQMSQHRALMPRSSIKIGLWFLIFMIFIGVFSWIGSFGGNGWISSPYDSIIVGVVSLGFYYWGLQSSKMWVQMKEAADTADQY